MANLKRSKINGLLVGENVNSRSCDVICTDSKVIIEPYIVGISIDPISLAEGERKEPEVRVTLSDGTTRVATPDEYVLYADPSYKVEVLNDHMLWGKEPGDATVIVATIGVNPMITDPQDITISPPIVVGLRFRPAQVTVPFSIGGTTAPASLEKQMSTGEWGLVNASQASIQATPGSDLTIIGDGSASVSFQTDQEGSGSIQATKHGFTATLDVNITAP